jgi:hypothetical protein
MFRILKIGQDLEIGCSISLVRDHIQNVPERKVIVAVILGKNKLYIYMCPIPNGFRDKSYFTVQFQNC